MINLIVIAITIITVHDVINSLLSENFTVPMLKVSFNLKVFVNFYQ
jgi:hypothetical protein